MDAAASDFGMLPKVGSITDRIEQNAAEVVVHRTRDGRDLTMHIPLDGAARENDVLGTTMRTSGHWDGDVLAISFTGERRGKTVSYLERWTVAPGGKSFDVARHLTGPMGETDQSVHMVKQ